MHLALSSLKIESLKTGKTPSQRPNQPNYAFYRV
nr:MAG TPA: hypothetical protein [Caudoviricetes sp.]